MPTRPIRVGVPVMGNFDWMGGVVYAHNLIKSNAALPQDERLEIYLVVLRERAGELHFFKPLFPLLTGIVVEGVPDLHIDCPQALPVYHVSCFAGIFSHVDIFYPLDGNLDAQDRLATPSVAWIPDFQHLRCPWFFTEQLRAERSERYARLSREAEAMVFSSQDALNDFQTYYPQHRAKTYLLRFSTIITPEWYTGAPLAVQQKYGLPDRFVVCANQLWRHKDHATLLRCMGLLAAHGQGVTLVCTGQPADPRAAGYFEELQGLCVELGLGDSVRFLGSIPRQEQIQLLRRCLAIGHPSLFEGWSTVVEDARALGKRIVLSDIPVHVEQAPDRGFFFRAGDAKDMARAMEEALASAEPGPDFDPALGEAAAREDSARRVLAYGRQFAKIAADSLRVMHTPFR